MAPARRSPKARQSSTVPGEPKNCRQGVVNENQIVDTLSQQLKIEKYHPDQYPIDMDLARMIPFETAQKLQVAPLRKKGRLLTVAMTDPLDINTMDSIEIMTNSEVEPVVCTEREVNQLINGLYGQKSGLGGVMEMAAKGAREAGGLTVGLLPGFNFSDANPHIDIAIPTGLSHARNMLVVRASMALIAVEGSYGTLSEIALALKMGKPVIGLHTWDIGPEIIKAHTAQEAVEKALHMVKKQ